MSRKKELYLVVDTETCNTVEEPIPYDIGYAICDREGNIYLERSFVIADTFIEMKDVMKSAYYAEKIPKYWDDIKSGKRTMKTLRNIRRIILEDMKTFNIKKVGAYNMNFDKRALNNCLRYHTQSFFRWFFPYGTEYFCIWSMACQVILSTKSYIKFALENDLVSEKGNILTSAEACYKFLTKDTEFVESHTGLEDVKIEIEIMKECIKKHKKMDRKPSPCCWRMVQKKRKALNL